VAQLLILSPAANDDVLPALSLLTHRTRVIPASPEQLVRAPDSDLVFLDARTNLIVTEGGLTAVTPDWGVDDVVLVEAGPAEVDTRIRLALGRAQSSQPSERIQTSGVVIDEASYSAKVHGRTLDLTYKEFELLRFLAAHPSRVFTREQLLSEVWGYDYFGGTRTVDVHVRRLRAKLGDLDSLIGTVRNVGYRFNVHEEDDQGAPTVTAR